MTRLFAFALAGTISLGQVLAAEPPPKVYVLAIGVADFKDIPAEHAPIKAKEFVAHVRGMFGNDVEVWDFIEPKKITRAEILDCLWNRLPKIPPGSMLITYYAGHGFRVPGYDRLRGSTLYFPLTGSSRDDPFSNSFTLDEFHQALLHTNSVFALSFLDCCFSGDNSAPVGLSIDQATTALGIRGMLLASSSPAQESFKGKFTDALLKVWSAKSGGPITPIDLQRQVQNALPADVRPHMDVRLHYGHQIAANIGTMNKESCLLMLKLSSCPVGLPDVSLQLADWAPMTIDLRNPYLQVIAPRAVIRVVIRSSKGVLFNESLDLRSPPSARTFPVTVPAGYATRQFEPKELAASELQVAEGLKSFGEDPSEHLLAAAEFRTQSDPLIDNLPLMNEILRHATDSSKPKLVADAFVKRQPGATLDVNRTLTKVGGYAPAAVFYEEYAQARSSSEATAWLQRALGARALSCDPDGVRKIRERVSAGEFELKKKDAVLVEYLANNVIEMLSVDDRSPSRPDGTSCSSSLFTIYELMQRPPKSDIKEMVAALKESSEREHKNGL